MYHFCYLYFVFVMLSCLFIAALWSPTGNGLASWLPCMLFYCVSVTFPCGVLAQVWYLILSIPYLYLLLGRQTGKRILLFELKAIGTLDKHVHHLIYQEGSKSPPLLLSLC